MPIIGLLAALLPIFHGLLAGTVLGTVLSGLTFVQWAEIAGSIAGLIFEAPQIEAELRKIHSSIDQLITDIKTHGHVVAAQKAHAKYSAPPAVVSQVKQASAQPAVWTQVEQPPVWENKS